MEIPPESRIHSNRAFIGGIGQYNLGVISMFASEVRREISLVIICLMLRPRSLVFPSVAVRESVVVQIVVAL